MKRIPILLLLIVLLQGIGQSKTTSGFSSGCSSYMIEGHQNTSPDGSTNREPTERKKIAFLSVNEVEGFSAEQKAAYDFLVSLHEYATEVITFKELKRHPKILSGVDLIWYHRGDSTGFSEEEINEKVLSYLKNYISCGGKVFLTLTALKYVVPLDLETVSPGDSLKSSVDNGFGRKLGFHAYIDHPIFAGLNGGSYVWRPYENLKTLITGYFDDQLPSRGKVIGVDWDYIFIRENSKLILEYESGKGKVIGVGAYTWFSAFNFNKAHLAMFTSNIFDYLLTDKSGITARYWNYAPNSVFPCQEEPQTDPLLLAIPESRSWTTDENPLALKSPFATSNYCEVAGERMLVMGKECGGIEEIWAHPFMAFRDFEVGIQFGYKDTIYWLNDQRPEFHANPGSFSRIYKFPRAYLTEVVVADALAPAGVVHYEYKGVYEATLYIRFKSNLRLMWPYSERVTGSICYGWNSDLGAFVLKDKTGYMTAMIGGNKELKSSILGQYDTFQFNKNKKEWEGNATQDFQVAGQLQYALSMNDRLDIAFSAGTEGMSATKKHYEQAIRDPQALCKNAASASESVLSKSLLLTTPDPNFNLGYRWALLGTNRFLVSTPGMGKSLTAGYSTTKRGWDGGHKVNGRPGYGWYFGRDGEWSGMAMLDYGDFENVKAILAFFEKYQDLSGKVLHEATTSGVIHYDAADATPLYIVLAGKYFRHSNDTAYLIESWPRIQRAIEFCFSTDSDRDHLIENTNIGHGWVEGGKLYGSHSTLYLNACWIEALKEAFVMSKVMREPQSESYKVESLLVKKVINTEFWNKEENFYYYGKNIDGTFRPDPTILPAVALGFKLAEKEKAYAVNLQYASNAFTTNWGTRILRNDSPMFNPRGYHYGSVWPLFTGWASMAEYAYGNFNQGYSHIMNNLNIYKNWGLGFVEEVMNGAEYRPSGVCPHQCWSETMVLQPAIEGMLGLVVNAHERKITLSPHPPAHWDSLKAENIRMGDTRINYSHHRKENTVTYQFTQTGTAKSHLEFIPTYPAGTVVKKVLLNGKEANIATFKTPYYTSMIAQIELLTTVILTVELEGGIEILPLIQNPKPDDSADGTRIIASELVGKTYSIGVEGVPGTTETLDFFINGDLLSGIVNGVLLSKSDHIQKVQVAFEKRSEKYTQKTIQITLK